jgi:hypothetical protein
MPTILDLFKTANNNKDVTTWNGGHKDKGLVGEAMDFIKAEANPNGPRITFYKKLVTPPLLYGSETPRISLKGTVDPPRTESLKTARYNEDPTKKAPLMDLGSLLGGSANRPSDTIFESKDGAPVTRYSLPSSTGDHTAEKYAVEAEKEYFISKTPIGPNALSGVLRGDMNGMAKKAIGAGIGAAKKAVGSAVQKLVTKKRKANQKGQPPSNNTNLAGKLYSNKLKNSEYFTNYSGKIPTKVVQRKPDTYISVDNLNTILLSNGDFETDKEFESAIKANNKLGQTYIKIKPYGKQYSLTFPATITGISEDISPEWNNFKYIGSPFNTYRYQGVERSLKFEFKLYYLDEITKYRMISNLNSLKELVFPYNEISHIKYSDKDVALAYSPNLVEVTIGNLYKNILGPIDSLSFSIDDNTSWATTNPNQSDYIEYGNRLYPTVINVSFSMKIIERHLIDDSAVNTGTKVIRYNFDGYDNNTISARAEVERDMDNLAKDIRKSIIEMQTKSALKEMNAEEPPPPEENEDAEEPSTFTKDGNGVGVGTPAGGGKVGF